MFLFKSYRTIFLAVSVSLFFSAPVYASDNYVEQLILQAEENNLSQTRAWHKLVHYKPGLISGWVSQADDNAFFLAADGSTNPVEELKQTIRAIDRAVVEVDQHPQCRFPARYHWLKQALDIDDNKLLPVNCAELNEWFETIKPGSLTLVFPAAYINSPSSMFGHTLLRVNPDDYRKDTPLVSYALNYAANADATDSALIFSIKGLIGGYPGIFSIVPYYEKIKEYGDLENRDVWEYNLNFSREEITQLMRHAWEVRHIQFDYFFLTENCSYHMLSLMEVARPELELTRYFDVKAIPADTVRAVIDADLVSNYHYRPSSTTILTQHATQLSRDDNDLSIGLTKGNIDLTMVELKSDLIRARIYEQAYDYSRFLSTANPGVRDVRASNNWKVLAERSKIKIDKVWQPIEEPEVRSENGHNTARVALGIGQLQRDEFVSFQLRPAYHDVLDPADGYSKGGQINFLDLNVRYYTDSEKFRLEKITIINVLSLTPRDDYFQPISWGVDVAVERQPSRKGFANAAQIVVNGGYSYSVLNDITASLLGEVNLKVANKFDKGYSAGAGLKFSLLKQMSTQSMATSIKAIAFEGGEENVHQQYTFSYGYHISKDASIRCIYKRSLDYDLYRSDIQLAYHSYF